MAAATAAEGEVVVRAEKQEVAERGRWAAEQQLEGVSTGLQGVQGELKASHIGEGMGGGG